MNKNRSHIKTPPSPSELMEIIDSEFGELTDIYQYDGVIQNLYDRGLSWAKIHRYLIDKGIPCTYDQVIYIGKKTNLLREKDRVERNTEIDKYVESENT